MNVNNKFKLAYTVDDFTRFVLLSNYEHVVNVMLKERRYAIFEVSERHRKDRKYFKVLLDEIRKGGDVAFLQYLLDYKYDPMLISNPPYTQPMIDQKIESANDIEQFVNTAVVNGRFSYGIAFGDEVEMSVLHHAYLEFCQTMGYRHVKSIKSFSMRIRKYIPISKSRVLRSQDNKMLRVSKIPPIDVVEDYLRSRFGVTLDG